MKFFRKDNVIDTRVRLNMQEISKTVAVIKYYYRIYHYYEKDRLINLNKG